MPGADRSRTRVLSHLAGGDIGHSRTKARSPQTNGIVERFHKTMLSEFYQVAFRMRI